jgi:hypothetical protein
VRNTTPNRTKQRHIALNGVLYELFPGQKDILPSLKNVLLKLKNVLPGQKNVLLKLKNVLPGQKDILLKLKDILAV